MCNIIFVARQFRIRRYRYLSVGVCEEDVFVWAVQSSNLFELLIQVRVGREKLTWIKLIRRRLNWVKQLIRKYLTDMN